MLAFGVTFLITLANLAVLYFIMRKFLWKPVTDFMEKRSRGIENALAEAQRKTRRAEELEAQYEALLGNVENESEWVIRDAQERALEESAAIRSKAEAEAKSIIQAAQAIADQETRAALDKLVAEIASLAGKAAYKAAFEAAGSNPTAAREREKALSAEAEKFLRSGAAR